MTKSMVVPVAVGMALVLAACSDDGTGVELGAFQDCPVIAYQIGTTVSGSLTTSDCLLHYHGQQFGEYVDYYAFSLGSQRTVTIDMRSAEVDAYLIVWNRGTGQIVAEDDDGGSGLDARITADLPSGNYVIGATSFWPGETGSYTLSSN